MKRFKVEQNEEPYTDAAECLHRFLERGQPWYENRRQELEYRPLVQEQAFGESLPQLERLAGYEVHLDHKLERVLTMLFRLKDLRQDTSAG